MSTDPTVLSRIVRFVKQAGAPSEDTYSRDGFLSHHAESHAIGIGIGLGVIASATGEWKYVGGLLAAAFGLNRGPSLQSVKITEDIRSEPQYLIGGLAIGIIWGFSFS